MRTLPLRLSPVDGESLLGYIARYAHTFQLQPGDVITALGLEPGAGSVGGAARYGVSLTAEQLQQAAFATGVAADVLEGMLLSRYAGRVFERAVTAGPVAFSDAVQGRQVWIWCSRFCPSCLREDGGWRVRWQLGWSAVCATHEVLLRVRCPRCGRVPQVGTRRRWHQDQRGLLSDPSCCSHRHRHGVCRLNLAGAETESVDGELQLLAAQRRINELLDGDLQPTLAGVRIASPSYLCFNPARGRSTPAAGGRCPCAARTPRSGCGAS